MTKHTVCDRFRYLYPFIFKIENELWYIGIGVCRKCSQKEAVLYSSFEKLRDKTVHFKNFDDWNLKNEVSSFLYTIKRKRN